MGSTLLCFDFEFRAWADFDIYRDSGRNVEIKACSYQVQEGFIVLTDDLILIAQPSPYKLTDVYLEDVVRL
jgi:hypothetical protein